MTAFLNTFVNIVKSLLSLLFEWEVAGNVSVGSIFVGLFIARVAFTILIKGANMMVGDIRPSGSKSVDISDIKVNAGPDPLRIETHDFTYHDKYGG